jgi:hypothetical protein
MLCAFFYFQNPSGKLPPKAKPYAHSQLVIRLCCDFLNARTALLILPAGTGYKPIGCIVRKRGNDIRYLGQGSAELCQPVVVGVLDEAQHVVPAWFQRPVEITHETFLPRFVISLVSRPSSGRIG